MSSQSANGPRVAVVVPTYDREALVRATLEALTRQGVPASEFEVVVSDDGSSDGTRGVVEGFADRLRVRYSFQEDLGFRAAAARNAGVGLTTAPVLVFVDAGVVPGPDFLAAHLAVHESDPGRPAAVIGYTFGYRPDEPAPATGAGPTSPEELVRHHRDAPDFRDARHLAFERFGFDLGRCTVPWQWFWSVNCSVRAEDFHAVGGFDEGFRSWGGEDLELAFRLFRHGVGFAVSRDAWAVEAPHPKDSSSNPESNAANVLLFLRLHPEPVVELLWAWFTRPRAGLVVDHEWNVEDEHLLFLDALDRSRSADVDGAADLLPAPAGRKVAVFGCGRDVRAWPASAVLFDFDPEVVAAAGCGVRHAIGIRTPLPDDSVDLVVITPRLGELWGRWGDAVLREAHRIGTEVTILG
ncbi:glycosyltransferase [Saccharothrix lopnurensis]|uniref:Glycosyltransferase n=1 Tax=Saccharothrix lopnurensis TaxID=1670621 RepID=A0ABW1NYA6_9PSEU